MTFLKKIEKCDMFNYKHWLPNEVGGDARTTSYVYDEDRKNFKIVFDTSSDDGCCKTCGTQPHYDECCENRDNTRCTEQEALADVMLSVANLSAFEEDDGPNWSCKFEISDSESDVSLDSFMAMLQMKCQEYGIDIPEVLIESLKPSNNEKLAFVA
ncbi:MAG TPA: hypothetical protein DCL21_01365 [Alphaproteobacteria bacterium]|nr:hypothetical protein [Alphaproteobacteria bacterium]